MILQMDRHYKDRKGVVWKVINLNNGQREDIGPVSAVRCDRSEHVRIFKRDGTYSVDGCSQFDLIEQVIA